MISKIVYIIGLVLAIMAAWQILKLEGNIVKKVIFAVLVLITSWVGIALYYLWLDKKIPEWVK